MATGWCSGSANDERRAGPFSGEKYLNPETYRKERSTPGRSRRRARCQADPLEPRAYGSERFSGGLAQATLGRRGLVRGRDVVGVDWKLLAIYSARVCLVN